VRRRFRWWVGLSGTLAIFGSLSLAETAWAGSYKVFQCSPWPVASGNPGADAYVQPVDNGSFIAQNSCGSAIGVHNPGRASQGQQGSWTWYAPPGTAITRASGLEDLRNSHGYSARIFSGAWGDLRIADGNEYWQGYGWNFGSWGVGHFGVRLVCAASTCDSDGSTQARAYLRDVTFTLSDSTKPTPRIAGELVSAAPATGGWHRGDGSFTYDASDRGGGVAAYNVTVNGQTVGASFGQCQMTTTGYGRLMRPCSTEPFEGRRTAIPSRGRGATEPILCARAHGTSAGVAARTRTALRVRSRSTTRSPTRHSETPRARPTPS
jgi:hypothetical protein